jgi:hypothetical protein
MIKKLGSLFKGIVGQGNDKTAYREDYWIKMDRGSLIISYKEIKESENSSRVIKDYLFIF